MNCTCRICGNAQQNEEFEARERMFGWDESFLYFRCGSCGCLQIASIPTDIARFYPSNYYSFTRIDIPRTGWRARIGAMRDFSIATNRGVLGKLIHRFIPAQPYIPPLGLVPLSRRMHILDVGCGGGLLLSYLDRAGFEHLAGVDPYLDQDCIVSPCVTVRKLPIHQLEDHFDLIMLHHVFEHIENGEEMLQHCRERLSNEGKILLRFPTADSYAWEHYRTHWIGLDAPRHFFLHTRKSLELLARKAGLQIEHWSCDSSAMQFWASELYRKGHPLHGQDGKPVTPEHFFTRAELAYFAKKAQEMNRTGRGDQVAVILRPLGR